MFKYFNLFFGNTKHPRRNHKQPFVIYATSTKLVITSRLYSNDIFSYPIKTDCKSNTFF